MSKTLQALARALAQLTADDREVLNKSMLLNTLKHFEESVQYVVNGPTSVLDCFEVEPSSMADAYDKFVNRDYYVDDVQIELSFSRMELDRTDQRNVYYHHLQAVIGESHEEIKLPGIIDSLTVEQLDSVVFAFIEQATVKMCPCCGKPMWHNSGRLTNPEGGIPAAQSGICRGCSLRGYDQAAKDDAVQHAKQDAAAKRKGFTHKTDAWIHPTAGGDDYTMVMYTKGEPSARDLARLLRNSRVKTDYKVEVL